MRRHKSVGDDAAGIDMTPMLDVVFILLIFFIVTSNFLNEYGFDLTPPPPPADNAPMQAKRAVQIYIDQSNLVLIDGHAVDLGSVRANIERAKAENPDVSVVIQAHSDAKNKFVLNVFDQAKSANVENVALLGSQ